MIISTGTVRTFSFTSAVPSGLRLLCRLHLLALTCQATRLGPFGANDNVFLLSGETPK